MLQLSILNLILIAVIAVILFVIRKKNVSERWKNRILLIAPLLTVACHYSSLAIHRLTGGREMMMMHLTGNPNLLLPIYPCNVVMWSCLIFGICRNKNSRFAQFLGDYIFWFGLFSALFGMFVNVDFIRMPTFADYDVTKGILAHALMLFNVLLLPLFGYVKIDLPRNLRNILISMGMMFLIGCYCNLTFEVIASEETAMLVNSMFLLKSPFEGLPFLRFPLICLAALLLYFLVFCVCEMFAYAKGNRWVSRCFGKRVPPARTE